ncbi:methionyl-tRNA formyltransferase [Silvibacterium dinghuense]|uniref:Methionyl-tRNA formyltransferase n=1 Tax=Silvibacterium dinghuense TaxID=1560006 RepID=A0A4Q1SGM2_9BACT|nr:methionyl-tRNA formyltransferase [Silvibacterium dinghuense]RXS96678.1 methionyl-tRNA formyltransferase [Silvibacterium dinghuense]GGG92786.1 methionyl-tRNA formyltransferase [Silvibacterium dinghuense]
MKFVFCGTPSFAVPTFEAVLRAGHEPLLVVTQPDRPVGRKQELVAPPVKQAALAHGLPVVQPEKIKTNAEFRAQLEALKPDVILVVAYGRIIPVWMLDLPPHGNINLHGSLLPKYRGAAPIQWAVANGEPITGNTTMRIDEGLDTGNMLLQRELTIAPDMTSEDLFPRLAAMGADLMVETLAGLEAGILLPRKQDHALATHAPILTREDGRMNFSQPAMVLYNRWRGFQPWPGAWTTLDGKKLIVHRLMPHEAGALAGSHAAPGELRVEQGRLFAACGEQTWLELVDVQLEGKRRVAASEFLRGHSLEGVKLGHFPGEP